MTRFGWQFRHGLSPVPGASTGPQLKGRGRPRLAWRAAPSTPCASMGPRLKGRGVGTSPCAVTCVAFAPDGRTLASGSSDGAIQVWKRSTGANLDVLPGHPGGVFAVAFSADGRTLVSAGADGKTSLWDPAN